MIFQFSELAPYVKNGQIAVRVIPNASRSAIEGWDDSAKVLGIRVRAPPDKDRANKELIQLFKETFKKKVIIAHGRTSRKKIVRFLD